MIARCCRSSSAQRRRAGASLAGPGAARPRDEVVLPELDGRIIVARRLLQGGEPLARRHAVPIVTYRPVPDRVAFVADLAAGWVGCAARAAPRAPRRASSSRTIPTRMAASPMASATTRRPARWQSSLRCTMPDTRVGRLSRRRQRAMHRRPAARTRPTAGADPDAPSGEALSARRLSRAISTALPAASAAGSPRAGARPSGSRSSAMARSSCRSASAAMSRRHPAGARLQHRSEIDLSRSRISCRRMAISPSISGCATSFGAHAIIHIGKHGNLEWLPGKAMALSGVLLAGSGARPPAAALSVHRQRSRRGHAGQAPHRGRHHRSPDAAADARRDLRPAEGPRSAGRRILRRARASTGAGSGAACKRDILDLTRAHAPRPTMPASPATTTTRRCSALDAYLCDLKEAQIRDGLHIFGASPQGRLETRSAGGARPRAARPGRRRRPVAASARSPTDLGLRFRSARLRHGGSRGRGHGLHLQ